MAIRNDKEATCQGDRGLRDDVALVDCMRKIAPTNFDLQKGLLVDNPIRLYRS
jgi:hypothetical protein